MSDRRKDDVPDLMLLAECAAAFRRELPEPVFRVRHRAPPCCGNPGCYGQCQDDDFEPGPQFRDFGDL